MAVPVWKGLAPINVAITLKKVTSRWGGGCRAMGHHGGAEAEEGGWGGAGQGRSGVFSDQATKRALGGLMPPAEPCRSVSHNYTFQHVPPTGHGACGAPGAGAGSSVLIPRNRSFVFLKI